jgi:hypothetical protein
MQCSEKDERLVHLIAFDCFEHFSLANPLHLAIMGGQLGNAWDAGFHREFDHSVLPFSARL